MVWKHIFAYRLHFWSPLYDIITIFTPYEYLRKTKNPAKNFFNKNKYISVLSVTRLNGKFCFSSYNNNNNIFTLPGFVCACQVYFWSAVWVAEGQGHIHSKLSWIIFLLHIALNQENVLFMNNLTSETTKDTT